MEAIHVVETVADSVETDVACEVVDVDEGDAPASYSDRVPVVEVDGEKRFEYRVDATALRRLLASSG